MKIPGVVISCKVDRPNMHYVTTVRLKSGQEFEVRFPKMQRVGSQVEVKT